MSARPDQQRFLRTINLATARGLPALSGMRLLLLGLLISCTQNDRPPPEVRARANEPRAAREQNERSGPAKPSADVPQWDRIDNLDGPPAKPTAWKPDGRPTMVVFSASWC